MSIAGKSVRLAYAPFIKSSAALSQLINSAFEQQNRSRHIWNISFHRHPIKPLFVIISYVNLIILTTCIFQVLLNVSNRSHQFLNSSNNNMSAWIHCYGSNFKSIGVKLRMSWKAARLLFCDRDIENERGSSLKGVWLRLAGGCDLFHCPVKQQHTADSAWPGLTRHPSTSLYPRWAPSTP